MTPSSEREKFEAALSAKPEAIFWNTSDAMFWAWQAGRAALSTPHPAIQDLIKARDTFGWSPEVDEKINVLRPLSTQPLQATDKESLTDGWRPISDKQISEGQGGETC